MRLRTNPGLCTLLPVVSTDVRGMGAAADVLPAAVRAPDPACGPLVLRVLSTLPRNVTTDGGGSEGAATDAVVTLGVKLRTG
jgi:hypothetical protein